MDPINMTVSPSLIHLDLNCVPAYKLSHNVFQAAGEERRWGWEDLMGKWASSLSPPLESSLKGLERWCRGLSLPTQTLLLLFSSLRQQTEKSPGAKPGSGQTHQAQERNTPIWWLHRAKKEKRNFHLSELLTRFPEFVSFFFYSVE